MRNILEKVSYHAVYDESIADALDYAAANGFAGVQVAVEAPHLSFEHVSDESAASLADRCAADGLRITLHAPDDSCSLFTGSPYLLEGVMRYFRWLFEFAAKLASPIVTLHVGRPATFPTAPRPGDPLPGIDLQAHRRTLADNLRRVIQLAEGRFELCFENIGFSSMAREALQPHLDSAEIALCWDLAKGADNADVQAFMWANLGRVRQVHLHDVAGGLSHEVIGAGELGFMRWLPRLADADVVDYCIEVRPREQALKSFAALRTLIEGVSR